MSARNYSPVSSDAKCDPCSFAYQKSCAGRTAESSPSAKNPKNQHGKFGKAIVKSVKRIFSGKPKKAAFVMPGEYKNTRQPSMRARPGSTRISKNKRLSPVPAVYLTGPSVRRSGANYRVHSFAGEGSPYIAGERSSVRFSHPAVNIEVPPSSPVESAPPSVVDDASSYGEASRPPSSTSGDDSSVPSTFPPSIDLGRDDHPVRPKEVYRWSSQSITATGERESYNAFKARLDGCRPRSDRVEGRSPSLPYMSRMASINLDELTARLHRASSTDATAEVDEATEVEKHRSAALNNLEGGLCTVGGTSRFVLAIVPKKDLPITAVQLSSGKVPDSLVPGGPARAGPTKQRPHTYAGATSEAPVYQAYNASAVECETNDEVSDSKADSAQGEHIKFESPDAIADALEFNARHSRHYSLVESGVFDDAVEPTALPVTSRTDSVQSQHVRFESPDAIADAVEFNARHSRHYSSVESGVFDDAVDPAPRPVTPIAAEQPDCDTLVAAKASFLMATTPPRASEQSSASLETDQKTKLKRKPVAAAGPRPSKPSAATQNKSRIPVPHRMNSNRYPYMNPAAVKPSSARPKYQPRSINAVEAKSKQEQSKKTGNADCGGAQENKAEQKRSKKDLSEAEKKKEKKLADLEQLDAQLKKYILA